VGGGAGLDLGKGRVKEMIAAFGGRVTGSVSGKTNFVVVGKQPGASKVSQAKERGIPLVDLQSLRDRIMGNLPSLEEAEAPAIRSFSSGYQSNRITYY
jgi:BRCT domain type II-containing protein